MLLSRAPRSFIATASRRRRFVVLHSHLSTLISATRTRHTFIRGFAITTSWKHTGSLLMSKSFAAKHVFMVLQLMSLFTTLDRHLHQQHSPSSSSSSSSSSLLTNTNGVRSEPVPEPLISSSSSTSNNWLQAQLVHKMSPLAGEDAVSIARLSDRQRFLNLLTAVAIPRVSGTPGSQRVMDFITSTLQAQGYTIELDKFDAAPPPPHQPRTFTNIIATLNPAAPRQLVLACHHDSKYDRRGQFVGASDSAVPCAMMLDIAATLTPLLQNSELHDAVTLQLIFFDGEEAFLQWTQTDSLYGSRNLADKWGATRHAHALSPAQSNQATSRLKGIDVMVLLDLIGPRDVQFMNIFGEANDEYQRLVRLERDLGAQRQIKQWQDFGGRQQPYFKPGGAAGYNVIDDDHRPFLKYSVPILHLISVPFPASWHKYSDNLDNVHYETTDDVLKILRVFVCEYLHCQL